MPRPTSVTQTKCADFNSTTDLENQELFLFVDVMGLLRNLAVPIQKPILCQNLCTESAHLCTPARATWIQASYMISMEQEKDRKSMKHKSQTSYNQGHTQHRTTKALKLTLVARFMWGAGASDYPAGTKAVKIERVQGLLADSSQPKGSTQIHYVQDPKI